MHSKVIWKSYDDYTRLFSGNSRKLGFAAGAIAWIFREPAGDFPTSVEWAWVFIIGFFLADVLQYFVAAIILRQWMLTQEGKRLAAGQPVKGDYEKPTWLDIPAFVCLWLKFMFLIAGFVCLGVHIFNDARQ
jgi:hypothetical protein